jgi:hypothetical protein
VRVLARLPPAVQGGAPRTIEARRSLRFSGSRTLPISLDPECANVDCNPDPTAPPRTCVVRSEGGVRRPACVAVDLCVDGDCTAVDGGTPVQDAGATSCPSPLMETQGPATAVWDFESAPVRTSVGMFPDGQLPTGCTITDGIVERGVPLCGRFLRCVQANAGIVLSQAPVPTFPGFALGFYLRPAAKDVDLLRFQSADATGIDGALRIDATGFLSWLEVDKAGGTSFEHTSTVALGNEWQRVEVHVDAQLGAVQIWTDTAADTLPGVPLPSDVARLIIVSGGADLDRLEARPLP